jgi:hypothetical protein
MFENLLLLVLPAGMRMRRAPRVVRVAASEELSVALRRGRTRRLLLLRRLKRRCAHRNSPVRIFWLLDR